MKFEKLFWRTTVTGWQTCQFYPFLGIYSKKGICILSIEKKIRKNQSHNPYRKEPLQAEDLQQKTRSPSSVSTTRAVKKGEKNRTECFCAYRIKINYSVVFFCPRFPLSTTTFVKRQSGSEASKEGSNKLRCNENKAGKNAQESSSSSSLATVHSPRAWSMVLILRSLNGVRVCLCVCDFISYRYVRSETERSPQSYDMIFNGVLWFMQKGNWKKCAKRDKLFALLALFGR